MGFSNKYLLEIPNYLIRTEPIVNEFTKHGEIELDARLWPNQYYYHTNLSKDEIPYQGSVKVLEAS